MNPLAGMFDLAAVYWAGVSANPQLAPQARAMAAKLSGANDMMAAASDPANPNCQRAWAGEDIYVAHQAVPGLGWVRKDGG